MEQKIKEEVKQQIAEMVANGLPAGVGEIIIREGKAVELKEPVKVKIQGTIDAAARWLETRFDCIKEKSCHVIVNREQLTIALQCNENNHYGTLVVGSLTLSPEYKRFGRVDELMMRQTKPGIWAVFSGYKQLTNVYFRK